MSGCTDGLSRQYMVTVSATGVLETTFMEQVQDLLHKPVLWEIVDEIHCTCAFNSLCFRALSKEACVIHQDIGFPHSLFPICLYKVLVDPTTATALTACKTCLMDEFSEHLLAKHGSFGSTAVRQILLAAAQVASSNTSQVEARHASIRRLLVTRSTQTWSMQFPVLSAEFLLMRLRSSRSKLGLNKAGKKGNGPKRNREELARGKF
eukprot:6492107-Amphidinium_carterae.1